MLVWRICKPEHAPSLDGEGARLWGGRWNSPGHAMIYCASSLALATLEVMVHLPPQMRRATALPELRAIGIEVPEAEVTLLSFQPSDCRAVGDHWLADRSSLALLVPSAIIARENNILLNPAHPAMSLAVLKVQEPFVLDARLFG